ncbi:REV1 [Lepeophtheirus salmonis]|uniref:REV1 n=1 Tax=Lepeophtheirus salmonis TaxID=72036 RepID=A0A7R8CAG9_LEPSM|nr:REV1 [Lepeophtheirus salmonis]CAF2751060.1 REV1 [Lepeophtheirus salmonis]
MNQTRRAPFSKEFLFFVNGYTDPPSDELRRIMMEHGGSFHHYLIPRKTTHIIATNLPETKIKNLKGDEVIVNPSWITDSVKTGSLLDYKPYLLYTNSNKNQPQIKFDKISRVTKDANDENFIGEFLRQFPLTPYIIHGL